MEFKLESDIKNSLSQVLPGACPLIKKSGDSEQKCKVLLPGIQNVHKIVQIYLPVMS